MKHIISILSLLFLVALIHAQPRINIKLQIQKCLDGSGNPIQGCMIFTDAFGQQYYVTKTGAIDTLLNNGLRDTIIAYSGGGGVTDSSILIVDDYAALKVLPTNANYVFVKDSLWGGYFYRNATGTPDSALIIDGLGSRKWHRIVEDNKYWLTWWINNDTSWSDEMQRAINIISTRHEEYGDGTLYIPDIGYPYYLDTVATDPYDSGDKYYCVELKSNITIQMDAGTVLKMSDNMITNGADSINRVNIFIGDSIQHVTITGGIIDGNAAGQFQQASPGFTGCGYYSQGTGNAINFTAFGYTEGTDYWNTHVYVDGTRFYNHGGIPINSYALDSSEFRRIYYEGFGEGMQFIWSRNILVDDINGLFTQTPCGDGFETSQCKGMVVRNIEITGTGNGTAIDLFGCQDCTVENFYIHDYSGGGIDIQTVQISDFRSNNVTIRNGYIENVIGTGIATSGDSLGRITIQNVQVDSCQRGFYISRATDPQFIDEILILDCVAKYNTLEGINMNTVKNVVIQGGFYAYNEHGIHYTPQAEATAWADNEVRIVDAILANNTDNGLYVQTNALDFGPRGFAKVYAYGNGLVDIDNAFTDTSAWIVRNVKPFANTTGATPYVGGETVLFQQTGQLWELQGGTHGQEVTIFARSAFTLFDKDAIGGNANVELGSANVVLQLNEVIQLVFDARAALWYRGSPVSHGLESWLLAASGTGGTETINNGETVTITGTDGIDATRSSANVILGLDYPEVADSISNYITFPSPGGEDSIVTCFNGDIGFIEMGDTTCVSTDSFYVIDNCTYFIIMNDTVSVCIPVGTPGQNISNSNLTMSNTPGGIRIFNIDTALLSIWKGSSRIVDITGDLTEPGLRVYNKGNTDIPTFVLNGTTNQTQDVYRHINGVTGALVKDYSDGLDQSEGAYVRSELNTLGDPYERYYGHRDSLIIYKGIKLDGKVWDEDGDQGTTGDVLTKQADGTVNWAAGGGGAIPINDLLAADGTNTIDNANYAQEWKWNSLTGNPGLTLSSNSVTKDQEEKLLYVSMTGTLTGGLDEVTYSIHGENNNDGSADINVGVYGSSLNANENIGVLGDASGVVSIGVLGRSTTGIGILGTTTSSGVGVEGYGQGTGTGIFARVEQNALPIELYSGGSTNNTIKRFIKVHNGSAGVSANGFGAAIDFQLESSTTIDQDAGRIASLWTDATHATRTSALDFSTVNAGTLARKMRIAGTGQLTLDQYTGTNFAGASTDSIATFDASTGLLRKRHASFYSGGSGLTYGLDNQVPFTNATVNGYDYSSSFTYDGTILSATRVSVPDGTAAAPAVKVGDEQNGLYSPGANQLGFTLNGISRAILGAIAFDVSVASSGGAVRLGTSNTSNTANSAAELRASVAGTSAGDPFSSYIITSGASWSLGADNSDSDAFVISEAATLGTSNRLRIATGGAAEFFGTVKLQGYTVATLPAGTVGMTAYVTDATTPTYLGAAVGGGAVVAPVFYNGAAWVTH